MTTPTSPAPRVPLTTRTPEDVLAVVPVVLGFEPSESVAMLTFGGSETFHARVDLHPPGGAGEVVDLLLEPALQHSVARVVFVVYAADGPYTRSLIRTLRDSFGRAGIDVVELLRAHEGRWFAPGRRDSPAAGVAYRTDHHLFRAQAVVEGIVVHGSRAELEAVLQPSGPAVEEVARAVRSALPSSPGEIADLVDVRLETGRFSVVELARVLLGLLEQEGRDAAWAAMTRDVAQLHVRLWTDAVQRAPDDLVAAPAAVLAVAAWLAGHGALAWCAVGRSTPTARWRGWSPTCSLVRCRRRSGARAPPRKPDEAGYWSRVEPRTVGVEEELLVVDPTTRSVTSRAREVLRENAEHGRGNAPRGASDELDKELFRHQLEIRTDPTREVDDAVAQVVAGRRTAAEAAAALELAVAVCASVPLAVEEPVVSDNERYRDMAETYGQVARRGTTCGMHVHVGIGSPEEGVRCIDRMSPWLPVLLAASTNSPFDEGRDTGYASWRTQLWSTWPSAGPTERFGSLAGYRRAGERMIASGAARDPGMLYFDARLSEGQPTLEVRILDAVTDPEDVGLLTALVRALVETAVDGWPDGLPDWRSEELRAARWRASRYGLADRLLDPASHALAPAREVLSRLVELVSARLSANGDDDRVAHGVERVLSATGATRQRAAYERTGSLQGVVDDVLARTADSWASRSPGEST